jgi:hypothetical protein
MPGGRRAPNGSPKCRVISYSGQVGTGGRLCLHALHSTLGSKIAESDCYTEETIFETYITEEGVAYLLVLATTNSETGKSSLSCEFQAWCEHDKEAPMKNRFTVMEDWVHWQLQELVAPCVETIEGYQHENGAYIKRQHRHRTTDGGRPFLAKSRQKKPSHGKPSELWFLMGAHQPAPVCRTLHNAIHTASIFRPSISRSDSQNNHERQSPFGPMEACGRARRSELNLRTAAAVRNAGDYGGSLTQAGEDLVDAHPRDAG